MKSLYVRMCLIFCSVIIVSSVLGFLATNIFYQKKLKSLNDAKLTEMALQLQQFNESHPDTLDDYLESVASLGYKVYLRNVQGEEWFYGKPFKKMDLKEDDLQWVLNGEVYHGVAEFPSGLFITGFFDNELRNSIGVPLQINDQRYALFLRPDAQIQFGEFRVFIVLLIGITILLCLGFVLITSLHIVRPISRLTMATKSIVKGQYDIKLNTWRRDEIGQLATHFMTMTQELERTNRSRQEFVANVSHEIESPLTSIQGFAHTLKETSLSDEQRNHYLSIIEEESQRLSMLSKQLLTLSMLDYDDNALQMKSINLRSQLRQVIQMMEWKLTDKQLALRLTLPDMTIHGDANMLYQVWVNLISNAIKYTAEGGTVTISAKVEGEHCIISVSDTGEGMTAEELPMIFDRFYKVDRARTRETHSTGLGLSIVQKIIHSHKGSVEVTSELGQGTIFTITLPYL
ncbi:sensor histidine kinase [Paenibacillus sp. FA6]|uniref:sensor histidine kinase n=1 Tax=Paenibacillus sp. FA6 TaxID=3413029 RepID=UPI003F6576DF